jgi:hypothetical protein
VHERWSVGAAGGKHGLQILRLARMVGLSRQTGASPTAAVIDAPELVSGRQHAQRSASHVLRVNVSGQTMHEVHAHATGRPTRREGVGHEAIPVGHLDLETLGPGKFMDARPGMRP